MEITEKVELTNLEKLKALMAELETERLQSKIPSQFIVTHLSIFQIEIHCGIKRGSLSKALKRDQESVIFDGEIGDFLELIGKRD
jgi:hypothetical protein